MQLLFTVIIFNKTYLMDPDCVLAWCRIHRSLVPNWYQLSTRLLPKGYRVATRLVPDWYQNSMTPARDKQTSKVRYPMFFVQLDGLNQLMMKSTGLGTQKAIDFDDVEVSTRYVKLSSVSRPRCRSPKARAQMPDLEQV